MNAKTLEALQGFEDLPNVALVRKTVVAALFGVTGATIGRWVKIGHIPKPRRLGGTPLWNVGELRAVIAAHGIRAYLDRSGG